MTLTKKNREPCTRTFTAYLYIFSENLQRDEEKVLDKIEHEFSFEHQNKIEFSGNQSRIEHTKSEFHRSYGDIDKGYLVLVEDDKGKILCIKGSRPLYEDKASQIRKANKGSLFDADFNPMNQTNKKNKRR